MKLSKKYTTVTPLSKILALILFIALPFIGFYLGMLYQKGIDVGIPNPPYAYEELDVSKNECTLEAKLCADGSSVGRQGPACEFALCPEEK